MVMIRMGIVTDLVQSGEPRTAKELSISCGGDELLIGRPAFTNSLQVSFWEN